MQPGDIVGGRFRLERAAGQGAMGSLFRATDLGDGSATAVKIVRAESTRDAQRFLREARILASLAHPAIVHYRAHGSAVDGALFLAMEWVEGPDLATRLRGGGLTASESLALTMRVAQALGAVHRSGVVHRDVKPANIVLPQNELGRAKLVDFGVAHLSPTQHGVTAYTRTGVIIGTPGFLAPEQVTGARVDGRADIFALGCVLYECLTGRPLFFAENLLAMLARIVLDPTPVMRELCPDMDDQLSSLVQRMLAKDPEARPRDAAELIGMLQPLLRSSSADANRRPRVAGIITPREQRLVSIVAARTSVPDSFDNSSLQGMRDPLHRLADTHAARLAILPGGSLVAVVGPSDETPFEQTLRAGRLALALRELLDQASVVIVSGRQEASQATLVGEAIDRAAGELDRASPGVILLDRESASLLQGRFVVDEGQGAFQLLGEQTTDAVAPRLLGRHTPFVGRQRELALLLATFRECSDESASRAVLVTADAGMGKSRLAWELGVELADEHGSDVMLLDARADPMGSGAAYAALAPALRRSWGIVDGDPSALQRQRICDRVAALGLHQGRQIHVAARLGEIAGVPFADEAEPQLRSARLNAQLLGEQVQAAFVDWLSAECTLGPRLIVLDDLHWGDVPTVRLLDEALSALEDAPLMVLGLGRPQTRELFPKVWEGRNVTELKLGKLSKRASESLVRAALGQQAPDGQVQQLAQRAEGNAFFLEELIRSAALGVAGTLPDTVLGMVEARLAGLDDGARLALRAASVFGELFWQGGVEALLGAHQAGRETQEWLRALSAHEVILAQGSSRFLGEVQFAFRHSLLREACYATLDEQDRRTGHRLAADWLQAHGEDNAGTLATHLELGGEKQRAIPWLVLAARGALQAGDLTGAVRYAERGVKNGAQTEALGELCLCQGEAFIWMGEPARAKESAEQAVRLLAADTTSWCSAVAALAEASALLGTWEAVQPWVDALCNITPSPASGSPPHSETSGQATDQGRIAALGRVSFCLVLVGRLEAAQEALSLARGLADRAGMLDPLVVGHLAHARATLAMMSGRREQAAGIYATAAEAFDDAGARRLACGARTNVGAMYVELGAYERALGVLEKAVADGQQARSAYAAGVARLNLGIAMTQAGRSDEGMTCLREAIDLFLGQGDIRLEASARCALTEALLAHGDVVAAERHAREAVRIAESLAPARASALATLAQALLRTDRASEALEATTEGMALLQAHAIQEGEIPLRLSHAQACAANGQPEDARAALLEAYRRIQSEAEATTSPDLRQSFLQRVPANARVLELVQGL